MTERLLTLQQVKQRIGFGHDFIYKNMRVGKFPKPVRGGESTSTKSSIKKRATWVRWLESDIDCFIADLIAKRDA